MTDIEIAKVCGLCYGSNRAITETFKTIKEQNNVVLFKEILHNKTVKKHLEENGATTKDNLCDMTKDDFVIIRAHGEPKSTYDFLKSNGIKYLDCTCPNVMAINLLVEKKQTEGFKIILIGKYGFGGKPMHPEVMGTAGWCDSPIFVEDESEIENIDLSFDKYFLAVQTTFSKDKATLFIEKIKNKIEKANKVFEFKNTICNAQRNINEASVILSKDVDVMFVIGGKNSSNTKELFLNVSNYTKAYKIEDPDEVFEMDINELKSAKKIGITAGASTMQEDILKLKDNLNKILN